MLKAILNSYRPTYLNIGLCVILTLCTCQHLADFTWSNQCPLFPSLFMTGIIPDTGLSDILFPP